MMRFKVYTFFILCSFQLTSNGQINHIPDDYIQADKFFVGRNYDKSQVALLKLINTQITDSLRAECFLRLGGTFQYKNNIDSAISFYKKAEALFLEQKNYIKAGRAYEGLGKQFNLQKNYTESVNYYNKALQNYTTSIDSLYTYLGILVAYLKQDKIDTGYFFTKKEFSRFRNIPLPLKDYYINETAGLYFALHNLTDSALVYFKRSIFLAEDDHYRSFAYNSIANVYCTKKQFEIALIYMDSATRKRGKDGWTENIQMNYATYKKIYFALGEYKKAYLYADSAQNLSDSLFNTDATRTRLESEAKYQNQQILTDKALTERQRSISQRNFIIALAGLGFIALVAFVSLRISRVRKKANQKLSLQKEQVQQLADELALANDAKARLFSTIGHDLRSPVSSLYALLKMQEINGDTNNEMSEHTVQLLDTLEDLLVWSKSQMEGFVLQPVKINLHDLCEELQYFYTGAAQAKQVSLINNAQDIRVRSDENILKTILRNAISNAIAHTAAGNAVVLSAESTDDSKAMITVKNPCSKTDFEQFKISFENAAIKSNTHGLGIVLMKEFAQKINAQVTLSYEEHRAVLKVFV